MNGFAYIKYTIRDKVKDCVYTPMNDLTHLASPHRYQVASILYYTAPLCHTEIHVESVVGPNGHILKYLYQGYFTHLKLCA